MAWKSASYSPRGTKGEFLEKINTTIQKHRPAMDVVLEKAERLSQERKEAVDKIQDPELRKSATR